jgi:hypothetical protein
MVGPNSVMKYRTELPVELSFYPVPEPRRLETCSDARPKIRGEIASTSIKPWSCHNGKRWMMTSVRSGAWPWRKVMAGTLVDNRQTFVSVE